jgi:hypothetical protein
MREELFRSEGRIGLAGVVDSGRELCCLRYKKEGKKCISYFMIGLTHTLAVAPRQGWFVFFVFVCGSDTYQ